MRVIGLLTVLLLSYGIWRFVERPPTQAHVRVIDVLNGDDIVVRHPSLGDVPVHYIGGIDAPETNHPRFRLAPGAREAAQANRDIALHKWVRLETDVQTMDRFDRVLAYVWVHQSDGSEVMANAELVWRGHARATSPGAAGDLHDCRGRDVVSRSE